MAVAQQRGVTVMYDGVIVVDYAVDLIQESVIVELKALGLCRTDLIGAHRRLNDLRAWHKCGQ